MLLSYLFFSISVVAIVLSLYVFFLHRKKLAELNQETLQLQAQQAEFANMLLPQLSKVEHAIDTIESLHQKIEKLQRAIGQNETAHEIEQLKQQVTQLSKQIQASPQDKLYTRAIKMAELGADIQEICQQCDISPLEAETLLAIRRQKPQK